MAKLLSATIRMYYTGFGDCFLLTFWYGTDSSDPAKKGKTLWIDFGARAGKAERMQAIATHLKEHLIEQGLVRNDKPFIDVLAITHEHQDHISGLKQAWEQLDELTFGQVWFAWTEDPTDELAKSWRKHKQKTRDSLQKANQQITAEKDHLAAKPGTDPGRVQVINKLASQLDLAFGFELGVDSVTDTKSNPSFLANADYQKLAEKVGAGNVRFLRPGYTDSAMKVVPGHVVSENSPSKSGVTTFSGLSLYVLGPPRDLGIVRASEPENWQTSLRADSQLSGYNFEQANFSDCVDSAEKDFWYYVQKAPFDEEFVLPIDLKTSQLPQLAGRSIQENATYVSRTVQDSFNNLAQTQVFKNYFDPAQSWRQIDTDYLSSANDMAIKLNTGVNNTSLVLAIEIDETEEVFFFSGDAEFGVWDDWDKDQKKAAGQRQYTWTRPTSTGTRNVTVEDLMSRAIFYKIGHHGSQDATPNTRGIGKLSNPHLHCMIPVDEKVATNFGWNRIPYGDLIKTLTDRQIPFVRADNSAETIAMAQQRTKVLPSGSQVTWSRDDDKTDRNLFIDWRLTLDRQAK